MSAHVSLSAISFGFMLRMLDFTDETLANSETPE
jgi:hypothetical protein